MRALFVILLVVVALLGAVGLWSRLGAVDSPTQAELDTSLSSEVRVAAAVELEPVVAARAAPAVSSEVELEQLPSVTSLNALNDRGLELLESREYREAMELFERCRAQRPDIEAYSFNLSEALSRLAADVYQEGNGEEALALLARAVELAPERDVLVELLARWRKTVAEEGELWQYETDHFELVFDSERRDILHGAQDVLDVLEEGYLEFSSLFAHDPVAEGRQRIRVVLTSRSDFQRATGLGEWAGGAYDGTIRLPLSDLDSERGSWTRILRHELGHVWMRELGGSQVPGWLNEGLCQWLEGGREELLVQARRALRGHSLFSLAQLTGSLIQWSDAAEVGRAYAQAFLFLDSLMKTYGVAAVLEMAKGCKQSIDPAVSFERETLVSLSVAFNDFIGALPR